MKQNLSENIQLAKAYHCQIVSRCNSSWERVSTGRFLSYQSYVPDIVNPINANADKIYGLAVSLAQAYDKIKKQTEGHSKQVEQEVIRRIKYESAQAQQAIINQKNEEKQYIRTQVEEERNLKNQFYNSYRNEERLRINANKRIEELQRQLNAIKAKASTPQTSYYFQKSGGSVTENQKATIQEIINKACKGPIDDRCNSIHKNINNSLPGVWGVITGLSFGHWRSIYSWEKWLIFSSNKENIFIWKQKEEVIPSETSYSFLTSDGDVSENQKNTVSLAISKHILTKDTNSNIMNNIQKEITSNLGGSWGIAIGLQYSWDKWCIKAPAQKWMLFNSNLKCVFVWKNFQIQIIQKQPEESKNQEEINSFQSLESLFANSVKQQKVQQVKVEEQVQQANHSKCEKMNTEFMLIDSENSPGTESTYIRVLLNQLMLLSEDPFVRVEWVKQLMEKEKGGSWGIRLNVPLADWASKQDYSKWYIYQRNGTQVLIWSRVSTEPLKENEQKQEQLQLPIEPLQIFEEKLEQTQLVTDNA